MKTWYRHHLYSQASRSLSQQRKEEKHERQSDVGSIHYPGISFDFDMEESKVNVSVDFPSRIQFLVNMIGVSLSFPNICTNYGKTQHITGQIKIFIALIYYPVDPKEQVLFNLELPICYDKMSNNARLFRDKT